MPVLPFRFFNVFGPLQPAGHAYAAVIPTFVDAALAGDPLVIHGDGGQSRDFTYVGTVVSLIADAIVRGVTSDVPVNLAFGSRITLLEVIAEIEAIVGHPVERQHVEARAGDVRHSQADNHRLLELFPDVEPVPLATGLRSTVEWMRAQRSMPGA
jgi:UDP-glucose 4-epimerase